MLALTATVCLAWSKPPGEAQAPTRFEPVEQSMHGWTVHVDPALLKGKHKSEGARALSMLANHLERISILVTGKQLAKMRKLELWIEREHASLKNMQYHPSVHWLRHHGHDERLAKKVHIPVARHLLSRSQMLKHPAVVLHELAHAYHH
jgi:dipeptidyl-peptidase-4